MADELDFTWFTVVWDHREQPDWDDINRAQQQGYLWIQPVPDTQSDQFAVICAPFFIDTETAQRCWDHDTKQIDEEV